MVKKFLIIGLLIICNTVISSGKILLSPVAYKTSAYSNILDIVLSECGDSLTYKICSCKNLIAQISYVNNDSIEMRQLICLPTYQYTEIESTIFDKIIDAYNNYLYKVIPELSTDYTKITGLTVPIIKSFQNRWKRYTELNRDNNVAEFSVFIRRDILSAVKSDLGEEHEYYKYLLDKYSPLLPFDDWDVRCRNWFKD